MIIAKAIKKAAILFTSLPYIALAQTPQDSIPKPLKEVVITGIIDKHISETTANIQLIEKEQLSSNDQMNYATLFNQVSGVYMQSGALNTNRITIRGMGARSPFGTTSIRTFYGDIPLNDGNGGSEIEDFDLASLGNIEIHKGPSASSFGAGLGGTIILNPDYGTKDTFKIGAQTQIGSFGQLRTSAKANLSKNNFQSQLFYSNTHSDGFRDNNEYNREAFTATAQWKPNSKNTIDFLGNYTQLKAFIPSSISLEDYIESPTNAAFTWGVSQGFEDLNKLTLGTSWTHQFSKSTKWITSLSGNLRENYEPRPFNILNENSKNYNIRTKIVHQLRPKLKLALGGEYFLENYKYEIYQNLYRDFPSGTGSVKGLQLSGFEELKYYFNIFGEASYHASEKIIINTGFNVNNTQFDISNTFENESNTPLQFDWIISPSLGILYKACKAYQLKVSIAHGYTLPQSQDVFLADNSINKNIAPEQGWNFEIGNQFEIIKNKLKINSVIFYLMNDNLLVTETTVDDQNFVTNAGNTNHYGWETDVYYTPIQTSKSELKINANFSLNQYYFGEYIDENEDYSDNKLTGVPNSVSSALAQYNYKGIYSLINYLYVSKMPINDANTLYNDSYQLVNLKLGYEYTIHDSLKLNLYTCLLYTSPSPRDA